MLLDKTIAELAKGLRNKEFTSVDLIEECYQTINQVNPKINAFITLIKKPDVLKIALQRDAQRTSSSSPLHGLPFILKDTYNTKGILTSAASHVLNGHISQYNATVYQKLLDAGAILIGKMNMDAWGHGATNENTDYKPVKNPYDTSRVAGGSSGGNAAAIAARMAVFGIGEDTGGSIRNPASWNNITGLKVTYGRVSRYGCIAYASSFDTVGPMGKTVEDCALVLETIAGKDPYDATNSPHPVPPYFEELLNISSKDTVIGLPKECFSEGLDLEIKKSTEVAAKELESLGFRIKEISMPMLTYGLAVYYLIAPSETSSNLGRYDGIRYGLGREYFTPETRRRIMVGTYALSAGYYDAYYKKAQQGRTLFIKEYEKAFTQCDVLLMPVTPHPPTRLGKAVDDPMQNLLIDVYTVTQNPVGVPSLALPCGFTATGLPIGMQLVGKMFTESLLFQVGHAYQQVTDWHKRKPNLIEAA
ncbi:TPA: Asp-tRNA(Asn)/Glu-tRNA(Gln) amidotransferase subunit GatA [Patescibacteria group bacterium]|uniref:Glutamyl-tRNA(Gln) amidotransferase subunit A n=1 Tax=Candidatus Gottesmanbacteria bacterium GW2011_GWA1_43_11 TaxID=1618436 RepID=A0A0G1CG53_9BACT|nr:MAG: Glutamyl-tRNA(Gln) amidotransferase subunit A [Candidatus Gottesmanbacteria bacterium GW2011_GWA1_43_11]HCS79503.1 Asp-tRNA(Asn)/Glu-tRNA(Gln) amidotransferase subunit GatA [Patescibacteria group bacterium]